MHIAKLVETFATAKSTGGKFDGVPYHGGLCVPASGLPLSTTRTEPAVVAANAGPAPGTRQTTAALLQFGAVAGLSSAVLYTAANVQLRRAVAIDPFLVAAVKAVPTVVGMLPVIVWYLWAGRPLGRNVPMMTRFAAVALFGQFVGNAAFQIALQHIALAVAVPVVLGTLIVGGGALGWIILGEPISRAKWVAMAILLGAVVVLSTGENQTNANVLVADNDVTVDGGDGAEHPGGGGPIIWFGALCAAASGAAYSLFGVVMRQTLQRGVSMPATLMISGVVGVVSLWAFCLVRLGPAMLADVAPASWVTMMWAGTFNFLAFVALSVALKFLPVVAVNLINASQVAMAAMVGVYFFGETINRSIVIGITLTVIGLVVLTVSGYSRTSPGRPPGRIEAST